MQVVVASESHHTEDQYSLDEAEASFRRKIDRGLVVRLNGPQQASENCDQRQGFDNDWPGQITSKRGGFRKREAENLPDEQEAQKDVGDAGGPIPSWIGARCVSDGQKSNSALGDHVRNVNRENRMVPPKLSL